jgi:hypothetical protein
MMNNFTDHGRSWEADIWSAGQEFSRLLWNPKIHYRFCKNLPSGSALSDSQSTFSHPVYFLFDSDMQVYAQFIW